MAFASGQILTGAALQAALDAIQPIRARSTSPTTYTSTTTFGNVSGLSAAVAANQVYKLRGRLKITGANVTHDVKCQFTLPAGASIEWSLYAITTSQTANPVSVDMSSNSGSIARGTIGGTMTYVIDGFITTAGTAGTAQLQAAQNTSDAGTLSIDAGSEISLSLWV